MKDLPYKTIKVTELPASEVEIEAEVPAEVFEKERSKTIAELNKEIKLDGFRSGHIPEKVIVERVGEMGILEHSAEHILPEVTYQIIVAQKIDSIGRPAITITKIAKGEPVTFKIKTAVFPKIEDMPDYKKIAAKVNNEKEAEIKIEDKEIDALILELRRSHLLQERVRKQQEAQKNGDKTAVTEDVGKEPEESELPVFDDAFVKALGGFKDVNDFKEKVRENMKREKEMKEREKRQLKMLEEIVEKTKVDVPEILVDNEIEKIWAQFQDDVTRMGIQVPQYLSHIKKTEAELRKDWRPDAMKKAKLSLVVDKISKEENLIPTKENVDHEVKHLMEHYKDAVPERARAYVEMALTNQMVMEFLEKQK